MHRHGARRVRGVAGVGALLQLGHQQLRARHLRLRPAPGPSAGTRAAAVAGAGRRGATVAGRLAHPGLRPGGGEVVAGVPQQLGQRAHGPRGRQRVRALPRGGPGEVDARVVVEGLGQPARQVGVRGLGAALELGQVGGRGALQAHAQGHLPHGEAQLLAPEPQAGPHGMVGGPGRAAATARSGLAHGRECIPADDLITTSFINVVHDCVRNRSLFSTVPPSLPAARPVQPAVSSPISL